LRCAKLCARDRLGSPTLTPIARGPTNARYRPDIGGAPPDDL